jgi:outer membrane immunogenic protein
MEWLFSPLPTSIKSFDPRWAWLFSPRPIIGASISAQDKTDEAFAGLAWDIPLTHGFTLEYQESGLIHNQALNVLYNDRPSPLTTRLLFREAIGLSYDINQSWRVVAFADHASDGNLGYRNEGLNRFGFLVGYKPGSLATPQPPEPPPAPSFNWNGLYAGLSVALARSNYNLVQPASNEQTNADDSVNIAAQAGYNWMIGPILAGFEADYSVQGLRGDAKAGVYDAAVSASSLWLATARGRLGVSLPVPKVPGGILFYGTGGEAFSEIANGYCSHSSSFICYNTSTGDVAGGWATQSKLQTGWTAGGGVEIPMAPTFTVKFEYLYVNFGKLSFSNDAVPSEQFTFTEQILRTGMNFKFN